MTFVLSVDYCSLKRISEINLGNPECSEINLAVNSIRKHDGAT